MSALAEAFLAKQAGLPMVPPAPRGKFDHIPPTRSLRAGPVIAGLVAARVGGHLLYKRYKKKQEERYRQDPSSRPKSPALGGIGATIAGLGALAVGSRYLNSRVPTKNPIQLQTVLARQGKRDTAARLGQATERAHQALNQQGGRHALRNSALLWGGLTAGGALLDWKAHRARRKAKERREGLRKQAAKKTPLFSHRTRLLAAAGVGRLLRTSAKGRLGAGLAGVAGKSFISPWGVRDPVRAEKQFAGHAVGSVLEQRAKHVLPRQALLAGGVVGVSALADLIHRRLTKKRRTLKKMADADPAYFERMKAERPELYALVDRMFAISPEREAELAERYRVSREKHGPPKPEGHSLDAFHW